MRGGDEQRPPVRPAEHAGEAAAVERDCLQYFAALAHARAAFVGDVGVPDSPFRVEADAVGAAVAEVGPDAAVRQVAVGGYGEGGQPVPPPRANAM
jgi:hypothetical protein